MRPTVAILMGSDSDAPSLKPCGDILRELGIPFIAKVLSAHRTPDEAVAFVKSAKAKGFKVIIAAAGGAAHLAGVTAAHTTLPVIGVPIMSKSLDGMDSLLSTVQMPPGIPVATVGINGAKNAGLLAVQILATSNEDLTKQLEEYKKSLESGVLKKNEKISSLGYKKYLEESGK